MRLDTRWACSARCDAVSLPAGGRDNLAGASELQGRQPSLAADVLGCWNSALRTGALTHLGISCTVEGDARSLPSCECQAGSLQCGLVDEFASLQKLRRCCLCKPRHTHRSLTRACTRGWMHHTGSFTIKITG
jgi:hypothetical protein